MNFVTMLFFTLILYKRISCLPYLSTMKVVYQLKANKKMINLLIFIQSILLYPYISEAISIFLSQNTENNQKKVL